jgi:hypothetical protein
MVLEIKRAISLRSCRSTVPHTRKQRSKNFIQIEPEKVLVPFESCSLCLLSYIRRAL